MLSPICLLKRASRRSHFFSSNSAVASFVDWPISVSAHLFELSLARVKRLGLCYNMSSLFYFFQMPLFLAASSLGTAFVGLSILQRFLLLLWVFQPDELSCLLCCFLGIWYSLFNCLNWFVLRSFCFWAMQHRRLSKVFRREVCGQSDSKAVGLVVLVLVLLISFQWNFFNIFYFFCSHVCFCIYFSDCG